MPDDAIGFCATTAHKLVHLKDAVCRLVRSPPGRTNQIDTRSYEFAREVGGPLLLTMATRVRWRGNPRSTENDTSDYECAAWRPVDS
jgi:hypothetical protein